jgi:hypothetical protein
MPSLAPNCCLENPQRLRLTAMYLPIFAANSRSKAGDDDVKACGNFGVRTSVFSDRDGADIIYLSGMDFLSPGESDFNRPNLVSLCLVNGKLWIAIRGPQFLKEVTRLQHNKRHVYVNNSAAGHSPISQSVPRRRPLTLVASSR